MALIGGSLFAAAGAIFGGMILTRGIASPIGAGRYPLRPHRRG